RAGIVVRDARLQQVSGQAYPILRTEVIERASVQLAMFAWVNVKRLVEEVFFDRTGSEAHLVTTWLAEAEFGFNVNLSNHLPGLTAAQNLAVLTLIQPHLPNPTLAQIRAVTAQVYGRRNAMGPGIERVAG